MRSHAVKVAACLLLVFVVGGAHGQEKFKSLGTPLQSKFSAADPDVHVWGDTLWVYCSQDANLRDYGMGPNAFSYEHMDGYRAFSTKDMVNWVDHGEIFHSRNVGWGPSGWMWAPSAAWNGKTGSAAKYFLYYPHKDWTGEWRIGVATGPTPTGPFTDTGKPIEGLVGIDPSVFIDTDKKAYLYFNSAQIVRLKSNMIEAAESPRSVDYSANYYEEKFRFEEGSYMHKRGNVYYYSYSNWKARETTAYYATGSSPYGPFQWKGELAGKKSGSQDHHSIVQFRGKWYYFYHMDTPWDIKNGLGWYGQRRVTCFTQLYYKSDGDIKFVTPSSMLINAGGPQVASKSGAIYQWDTWYSSGNSVIDRTDAKITRTADGALYQTYRWGGRFNYDIPLADGRYRVTFKFAETYHDASGRRRFDVFLEGNQVIWNLDVFAKVGKNKAYDVVRDVTVSGNELNIRFNAVTDNAMISALRILPI
jgi:arabinoxylan arabinofuranohydrolase